MKKYLLTIALSVILVGSAILIYNRLNSGPEYRQIQLILHSSNRSRQAALNE